MKTKLVTALALLALSTGAHAAAFKCKMGLGSSAYPIILQSWNGSVEPFVKINGHKFPTEHGVVGVDLFWIWGNPGSDRKPYRLEMQASGHTTFFKNDKMESTFNCKRLGS